MTYAIFPFPILFLILLVCASCGTELPVGIKQSMAELPKTIDYNLHVRPILSDRCFACHGNDQAERKAQLRLDIQDNAIAVLKENPGNHAIVPGNLNKSQVFHRIISADPEIKMPPPESNLLLSDYEKAVLIRWIEQGAVYKPHWAFIPPKNQKPPLVSDRDWPRGPIDQFVLHEIEEKSWVPAAPADKETILRRLTFDLTGLPPTLSEMDSFLADSSKNAFEKVVDRLLASPHYGERMATDWLDLARFADTHGYTVDRYRDMSPWRDWVINAFNQNIPYDQFVTWQLAGDLLPNAGKEQILATGFNRNHQQNMEGGIVPEEFRVEYVADRTNTLGTAFLGLTMECARCHDHKYDPVSQKEYYQLFSFFNNVKEAGQISYDNAAPVPTLLLTDDEKEETLSLISRKIADQEEKIRATTERLEDNFEDWLEIDRKKEKRIRKVPNGLVGYYNLDRPSLRNSLNSRQKGQMKQMFADQVPLNLVAGYKGQALVLDGDAWLDLGDVGVFNRSSPFSIGLWLKIPSELTDGVIFHKGEGAALYNFRGYHLAIVQNKLEILMARTKPYNAIIQYGPNLPRDTWIHLMMVYDGSGKSAGLQTFLNGRRLVVETDQDLLYKDIIFHREKEPGLQLGARWRGIGLKNGQVDEIRVFNRDLSAPEVLFEYDRQSALELFLKPSAELSVEEKRGLKDWYLRYRMPEYPKLKQQLKYFREERNKSMDHIPEIMVMQEMKDPRPTFVLNRGQYDAPGEQVFPATPESILPMPSGQPANRLGLSRWLFEKNHPLTARVTVNRLWQQFFGQGLVSTPDDFGLQGNLPSHPALLDWLAMDFIASGWNIKSMIRQIVLSATYRQSSQSSIALQTADPGNLWLARGPSSRLSAEMMRDNALAASGLLTQKIGGKSVKPYQPEGLWRVNGGKYEMDIGKNRYRRSLYTFWKRSIPNPTQATFDAPSRSGCTVRRQKTSTPLQALILLNDPNFTEAAKAMGLQIAESKNRSAGISNAFRRLTGRNPVAGELDLLLQLFKNEQSKFKEFPEKTKGWLPEGEYNGPSVRRKAERAAGALVASTIMNMDATIVRR